MIITYTWEEDYQHIAKTIWTDSKINILISKEKTSCIDLCRQRKNNMNLPEIDSNSMP